MVEWDREKMNVEPSLFIIPISREHGSSQISIEVTDPESKWTVSPLTESVSFFVFLEHPRHI